MQSVSIVPGHRYGRVSRHPLTQLRPPHRVRLQAAIVRERGVSMSSGIPRRELVPSQPDSPLKRDRNAGVVSAWRREEVRHDQIRCPKIWLLHCSNKGVRGQPRRCLALPFELPGSCGLFENEAAALEKCANVGADLPQPAACVHRMWVVFTRMAPLVAAAETR